MIATSVSMLLSWRTKPTDGKDSTLVIFFTCATGSLHCIVVGSIVPMSESSDLNAGTMSQTAKGNGITNPNKGTQNERRTASDTTHGLT